MGREGGLCIVWIYQMYHIHKYPMNAIVVYPFTIAFLKNVRISFIPRLLTFSNALTP